MKQYQLAMPQQVFSGETGMQALESLAARHKKAAVFTDAGIRASGVLERPLAELDKAAVPYVVYDTLPAEPTCDQAQQVIDTFRESGADLIVAVGGGSVMDIAKLASITADGSCTVRDQLKNPRIGKKTVTTVMIPTTAGTGSEVDAGGVLSCEDNDEKLRLGDPRLFPVLSIVDPELMVSVPARLTAYQGFDALFHCVECYISNTNTPMGDMVCREGIRRASASLALVASSIFLMNSSVSFWTLVCSRRTSSSESSSSRSSLAFANTLGGYAMDASGTTGSHGLEHGMSAHHHDLPHGAGLIMIARAYHTWMIDHGVAPERYIDMARLMGNAAADDPHDFVIELTRLMEACHVADLAMSEWGITVEELPAIAHNALTTNGVLFSHDPVTLTDPDVVEILKLSYR